MTMAEREELRRNDNSGGESRGLVSRVLSLLKEFFVHVGQLPSQFKQFVHEVRVELKHVSWPTRDDVKATTVVVLVTIAVFGVFLFVVDWVSGWAVQRVFGWFK